MICRDYKLKDQQWAQMYCVDMLHMIGFFLVLVWFVPMGIFVSMSISDNVLPGVLGGQAGAGQDDRGDSKGKGKSNLFKVGTTCCAS